MKQQTFLWAAAVFLFAVAAGAQEIDERFYPIGVLPEELAATLVQRDVEDHTIDGALLRSQVAAGAVSVKGWDAETKTTTIDPNMVRIQENLEAYAQALVLSDQNIERLDLSETSITIAYRYGGKLFGFIPVRVRNTIEVSVPKVSEATAGGQIIVRSPWYHFFIAKRLTTTAIASDFAAQVSILNAQHQAQRVAQYLSVIGGILQKI